MNLTRRKAVLGLLGANSAVSLGVYELTGTTLFNRTAISQPTIDDLLAVVDIVYPFDGLDLRAVIDRYVNRLGADRREALLGALSDLNRVAYSRFGSRFHELSREEGKLVFELLGVTRVQSRPDGTLAERVRFHLVNSVLYAVLTHPAGTKIHGITNPRGYPGGFSSYSE